MNENQKPKPLVFSEEDNKFWKTKLTKIIDNDKIDPKLKVVCYIVSKILDTTLYLVGIWMWLNA